LLSLATSFFATFEDISVAFDISKMGEMLGRTVFFFFQLGRRPWMGGTSSNWEEDRGSGELWGDSHWDDDRRMRTVRSGLQWA